MVNRHSAPARLRRSRRRSELALFSLLHSIITTPPERSTRNHGRRKAKKARRAFVSFFSVTRRQARPYSTLPPPLIVTRKVNNKTACAKAYELRVVREREDNLAEQKKIAERMANRRAAVRPAALRVSHRESPTNIVACRARTVNNRQQEYFAGDDTFRAWHWQAVTASAVVLDSVSENSSGPVSFQSLQCPLHYPFDLHHPLPLPPYLISTLETGNALVTRLGLRVSVGGGDHLLSGDSARQRERLSGGPQFISKDLARYQLIGAISPAAPRITHAGPRPRNGGRDCYGEARSGACRESFNALVPDSAAV
ncbi:hypothetical protein EVAR_94054_1 [Eumeta japonica]|uniref:Uncharacterized protein n=1 Tax=Eumeta variegata TaxID=151549 RepID=A0A4C1V5H9_EUMVA|nr:hypothetical protein EVAR_94054_1 [Eumeta japonica]